MSVGQWGAWGFIDGCFGDGVSGAGDAGDRGVWLGVVCGVAVLPGDVFGAALQLPFAARLVDLLECCAAARGNIGRRADFGGDGRRDLRDDGSAVCVGAVSARRDAGLHDSSSPLAAEADAGDAVDRTFDHSGVVWDRAYRGAATADV